MRGRAWPLLLFIASGCAQVGTITGGEKDEKAPVLITAIPANGSTNFIGRSIVLEFDERIQLDRVRENLLISPPLDPAPDVRITGAKRITLTLNAPLRANTTYSFLIGEAIKDLTEGNTAKGLSYVLSTGDHLDSLKIEGSVVNAFTGKPEANMLVMVHDPTDTNTIRTGRPAYATRTKADGSYTLDHLRDGRYLLYALRDQNSNYRFDLPNEEIAFHSEPITPTVKSPSDTTTPHIRLRSFIEPSAVQQVREAKVTADGALRVVFARPAERASLRDVARVGGTLQWNNEWSASKDTVTFWPSDTTDLISGSYELRTDTIIDTLRYRPALRMPFNTLLKPTASETADSAVVRFVVSRPIKELDPQRFSVVADSLPVPFHVRLDSAKVRTILLKAAVAKGGSATVTVYPKGVMDIYGGTNDTLITGLGRAAEKSTGTLRVKIKLDSTMTTPLIVQLFDDKDQMIREALTTHAETVVWQRLAPGNHMLRAIADTNNNGRWDTGDLDGNIQPEAIINYIEPVHVRAAWDLGVDWDIVGKE